MTKDDTAWLTDPTSIVPMKGTVNCRLSIPADLAQLGVTNSTTHAPEHKSLRMLRAPGCLSVYRDIPSHWLSGTQFDWVVALNPFTRPDPWAPFPHPIVSPEVKMEPPPTPPMPPPIGPHTLMWPAPCPLEVPKAFLLPQETTYLNLKRKRQSTPELLERPPPFQMVGYPLVPIQDCLPTPVPDDPFSSLTVKVSLLIKFRSEMCLTLSLDLATHLTCQLLRDQGGRGQGSSHPLPPVIPTPSPNKKAEIGWMPGAH